MELKRYVLDTERCFIYDLTKEADVKKFEMISKFATHFVNGACKTSDNILDLVVQGDLVRYRPFQSVYESDIDEVYFSKRPIKQDNIIECKHATVVKQHIIAIYKKQPNGDYKRYEVQK